MTRSRIGAHTFTRVLAVVLAGATVAALGVACGSFGEASSATPTPEAGVVPIDEAGGRGDADRPGSPVAFSDSFDDDTPLPRKWTTMKQTGAATLKLVPDAGRDGSGGLVGTFKSDGSPQSSLLELDIAAVTRAAAYDAVVSFSARVNIVTATGVVLGPRFVVDGVPGTARSLSVTFKPGIVRLDPDKCDASDCNLPKDEIPLSPGWHRYVLTLMVRPPADPAGSAYQLDVDGAGGTPKPLPLLLSRPTSYGLLFGVSYSEGTAGGTLELDDASFVVTPR